MGERVVQILKNQGVLKTAKSCELSTAKYYSNRPICDDFVAVIAKKNDTFVLSKSL